MIARTRHLAAVEGLLQRFPVVALVGARQVGKTTLARALADRYQGPVTFLDLEDPRAAARLAEPILALEPLEGLVVVDEVQRHPELFPVLRVLADRPGPPARFLVLGSASPDLLRQGAESLAGRLAQYHLPGLAMDEVAPANHGRLWLRGGFPRSFLAGSDEESAEWRRELVLTFLERDLPQLGLGGSPETLRRFWTMMAHSHGRVWNSSAFARSFGVSDTTVRRYLDVLVSAFLVVVRPAWYENLRKRQVRSPKVYLGDSGVLHTLLGLETEAELQSHPAVGASWEGFAAQAVIARLGARHEECFFWATHAGAELDLLVVRGRRRFGFEVKRTAAPRTTRSTHVALGDLGLERLDVVHAGQDTFPLGEGIRALALERIWEDLDRL